MRDKWNYLKTYTPWLIMILAMDVFFSFLLWLSDIRIFQALFVILVLASVISFFLLCLVLIRIEIRRENAFRKFFSDPDKRSQQELMQLYGAAKKLIIEEMAQTVYKKEEQIEQTNILLSDFEEYVEMWAHEIKLPLSLLNLILDNRENELSKEFFFKLSYIRNQVQNQVSQILFYHRIKGKRTDYLFENIDLTECIKEVLEDYKPLLDEKQFKVDIKDLHGYVFTDYRAFFFMIGQIINNAIKYAHEDPCLEIFVKDCEKKTQLVFRDNGIGVKSCDLPYIFEKGFTGDSKEVRKKSTGMGLYLVKQLTQDLKIAIDVDSNWMEGFQISLEFV